MRKFLIASLLSLIAIPVVPAAAHTGLLTSSVAPSAIQLAMRDDRDNRRRDGYRAERRRETNKQIRRQQMRRAPWQNYERYDHDRFDPRYGGYQAERYYRNGRYYQPRRLTNDDRVYRGSNGRYYCRRNDGTTGLIIGAIGGTLLGRTIAPSGSRTLGSILGGAGGAVIGRSIGRNGVQCR